MSGKVLLAPVVKPRKKVRVSPAVKRLTNRALIRASAGVLFGGTALAALATAGVGGRADRAVGDGLEWVSLHFSHLGTWEKLPGCIFNASLIAAGTLLACSSWSFRQPRRSRRSGESVSGGGAGFLERLAALNSWGARLSGAVMGASLALAGLVPIHLDRVVHDLAARGVIAGFLGVLACGVAGGVGANGVGANGVGLRGPALAALALLGVGAALLSTGAITLTVFEAAAFVLIVWYMHKVV